MSASVEQVFDELTRLIQGFNFRLAGADRSMGRDLCRTIAGQIQIRAATESRGAGSRWKENTEKTKKGKEKYGWPENDGKPNFRTGQMLSLESLLGNPEVSEHEVTMTYGTGSPPVSGYSPSGHISKHDRDVTDVQKAGWAVEHDRPFYEIDDLIVDAVVEEVEKHLVAYLSGEH